jgi:N utilization substance protein A
MGVADNTRMELDRHTGVLKVFARKKVVESVADPKLEIALAEARTLNAEAELEDEIEIGLPTQEFGRIAAQTAKQVILQRVRDAERDAEYSAFIDKQGKIIRGTVDRIGKRNVLVDLGKAEAVITEREQIPGERYNPNDRPRLVQEVKKTAKGPKSSCRARTRVPRPSLRRPRSRNRGRRSCRAAAAREPGERAKVVASCPPSAMSIPSRLWLRGTRIQVISRELRSEKIDIVEWARSCERSWRARCPRPRSPR